MTAVHPNHPLDSTESSGTGWVRDNGNFTFQRFVVEKEIQWIVIKCNLINRTYKLYID